MRIEDFNWETLYEKVDNFMKSIKANEYSIATNRMSVVNDEPIVEVRFPKRANAIAIMFLDKTMLVLNVKDIRKIRNYFAYMTLILTDLTKDLSR